MKSIALLLLIFANCAFAASNQLPIKSGMHLRHARKIILAHQWKPYDIGYKHDGTELELYKHGIKEVETCSLGRVFCNFNYKKGDQCLRVSTVGEEIKDMTVTNWSYECPQEDAALKK